MTRFIVRCWIGIGSGVGWIATTSVANGTVVLSCAGTISVVGASGVLGSVVNFFMVGG